MSNHRTMIRWFSYAGNAPVIIIEDLSEYVQNLQHGTTTLNSVIKQLIKGKDIDYQEPQKRPSQIVLV